jgi:hypothetical protein
MGVFVLLIAVVSVGLTASPDQPFRIAIQPVFVRLGVDIDIKLGSAHLHLGWSAIPDS